MIELQTSGIDYARLRHAGRDVLSLALIDARNRTLAWAALFGTVSFELFGQLHHVVGDEPGDRDAYFAECVRRWTTRVGINPEQTQRLAREPERALEAVSE